MLDTDMCVDICMEESAITEDQLVHPCCRLEVNSESFFLVPFQSGRLQATAAASIAVVLAKCPCAYVGLCSSAMLYSTNGPY